MSLAGGIGSLTKFAADLRRLPTVVAHKVAAAAAPELTTLMRETFDAGEDAYGNTWAPGAEGQRITLKKSGGIAGGVFFLAVGTRIRMRLGVRWAKYQIGKRPIAPRAGGALPVTWSSALQRTAVTVCKAELGQ